MTCLLTVFSYKLTGKRLFSYQLMIPTPLFACKFFPFFHRLSPFTRFLPFHLRFAWLLRPTCRFLLQSSSSRKRRAMSCCHQLISNDNIVRDGDCCPTWQALPVDIIPRLLHSNIIYRPSYLPNESATIFEAALFCFHKRSNHASLRASFVKKYVRSSCIFSKRSSNVRCAAWPAAVNANMLGTSTVPGRNHFMRRF